MYKLQKQQKNQPQKYIHFQQRTMKCKNNIKFEPIELN